MITEKDLEKAIEFSDMIEKIKELYVPGETYFIAWGDSDFIVLDRACKGYGIENPILYSDYLDFAEWYKWEMEDENLTSLRDATEEQCIDTGYLWHTACDDATNTAKLLISLINDGWNPEDYFEMREENLQIISK